VVHRGEPGPNTTSTLLERHEGIIGSHYAPSSFSGKAYHIAQENIGSGHKVGLRLGKMYRSESKRHTEGGLSFSKIQGGK
jgi:hypothetical protein